MHKRMGLSEKKRDRKKILSLNALKIFLKRIEWAKI
jgi:hypothetical protein